MKTSIFQKNLSYAVNIAEKIDCLKVLLNNPPDIFCDKIQCESAVFIPLLDKFQKQFDEIYPEYARLFAINEVINRKCKEYDSLQTITFCIKDLDITLKHNQLSLFSWLERNYLPLADEEYIKIISKHGRFTLLLEDLGRTFTHQHHLSGAFEAIIYNNVNMVEWYYRKSFITLAELRTLLDRSLVDTIKDMETLYIHLAKEVI